MSLGSATGSDYIGWKNYPHETQKVSPYGDFPNLLGLIYRKHVMCGYGLTMDKEMMDSLDDSFSLETFLKEEAPDSIRKLDKEGHVN